MKKNIFITIIIGTTSLLFSFFTVIVAMLFAFSPLSNEFEYSGDIKIFLTSLFLSAVLLIPFGIYRIFVTRKKKKWAYAEGVLSALLLRHPEIRINKADVLIDMVGAVDIGGKKPIEALDELLVNRYGVRATLVSQGSIIEVKKSIDGSVARISTLEGNALKRERLNLERRRNDLKAMEEQRKAFERVYMKASNNPFITFLTPYLASLVLGIVMIFVHNQGIFAIPTPSFVDWITFPDNFTIDHIYSFHFGVIVTSAICNFIIPYKILS